ncbi:DUF1561 family protein [Campylobacter majalis]|uniref:DUF1561 family protein n=1 Tax=Campylobacter majalis TaxID=2790656 RepID=UPI003D689B42
MKKIYLLALAMFLLLGCSPNQNTNPNLLSLYSKPTPSQALADKPKDKQIQVRVAGNKKLCYAPKFSSSFDNGSYLQLVDCSSKEAIAARYDVFGRLAFNINDTWFCITAPEEVANGAIGQDYAYLSPCAINLSTQRYKVMSDSFYSNDSFYSLKDDGKYVYAARFLDRKLDAHIIDNEMKEWLNTNATPAGLNLAMYLQWNADGVKYYIHNGFSSTDFGVLYYNLQNGYIASYDKFSPTISCLNSNVGTKDWAWAWWDKCSDAKAPSISKNLAYFRPVLIGNGKVAMRDRAGNYLRLTRYGIHWGQLYTARLEFLNKDTQNSPTSEFFVHLSMQDWMRFIGGNEGDNLPFCPAPGFTIKSNIGLGQNVNFDSNFSQKPKVSLMKNKSLNPNLTQNQDRIDIEVWEPRLLSIVRSTTPESPVVGICGTCLLHAYQIIAEILEDPFHPRANGGYFFNTEANVDPFISFRARNSLLFGTLADIAQYYSLPVRVEADIFTNSVNLAFASSIQMLPQYDWAMVGQSQTSGGIDEILARIFQEPVGSIYLAMLSRTAPGDTQPSGHASVMLRTSTGVRVIPTNAPNIDLRDLRIYMQNTTNVAHLRHMLGDMGSTVANVNALAVLRVGEVYQNTFNYVISFDNCTGFGDHRRGNARLPSADAVNQCASGRCMW